MRHDAPGSARRAAAQHAKHESENNADDNQNPSDMNGGAGYTRETQYGGDQCDDQKRYGPGNHGELLLKFVENFRA
jgi:hypothetical protein